MREYRPTFRRQTLSGNTKKNYFLPILWILFGIIGIFFFRVYSLGQFMVPAGIYRIDKGATLNRAPEVFGLEIGNLRYQLWRTIFLDENIDFQVGEYRIDTPTSLKTFLTTSLKEPSHRDQTITILPGWNIYDIDDYLAGKNLIKTGEFLIETTERLQELEMDYPFLKGKDNLEGFLYPDTYRIRRDATVMEIARKMLDEFQKKIAPSYNELGEKAYEELILASIVEREERISSEQSVVAGILSKRVKEGIPMGADATVCTGYAKTQKQCTPSFIGEVIYQKHPFNTRNMQGYPPTPISNVPLDTWENTLAKKDSPYYYYLHDSNGEIHYGRTLEEHNANKRKYLQ